MEAHGLRPPDSSSHSDRNRNRVHSIGEHRRACDLSLRPPSHARDVPRNPHIGSLLTHRGSTQQPDCTQPHCHHSIGESPFRVSGDPPSSIHMGVPSYGNLISGDPDLLDPARPFTGLFPDCMAACSHAVTILTHERVAFPSNRPSLTTG